MAKGFAAHLANPWGSIVRVGGHQGAEHRASFTPIAAVHNGVPCGRERPVRVHVRGRCCGDPFDRGLAGAASGGSVCPAAAIDIGTYCLSQDLQTVNGADTADYFTATRACASQGGFLPSADELIGAANQVKLAGRLDDSSGDATIDQDPSDGLSDWREMSSTPVTTQSGSDASGTEGVSQQATGNPATGEPNPSPQPADTAPASLQYGTVIDNGGHGVFTGSEPVSIPERFRCAFNAESPANVPTTMSRTPADPTLTAARVISLTALGHRGIQTHVSCPVACRYRVSLQMSSKNARRFGLKGGARKAATLATSSTTPDRLGAGSEIDVWLKPSSGTVSDLGYWLMRLRVKSVASKLVLSVQPRRRQESVVDAAAEDQAR